ncbi:kelch-like protein 6 [Physella acuta]|uniref:kelch-like protein 6 n=1 Tax=Physella acuta TaxID=109671 RepID=UPI0027DE1CC8|nr:kelch-like protein 6 [Physella acuta]
MAVNPTLALGIATCFLKDENRENFSDFTVCVGDRTFQCHRYLLSACSGFFQALLRSDMKERTENEVTLKDVSPDTFQLVLDVIYKAADVLTKENVIDVWHAACMLQIDFLTNYTESFLTPCVTVDNYWDFYTNAILLNSSIVKKSCLDTMATSFIDLTGTEHFVDIYFDDLYEILKHNNLCVCPDFVVPAIARWVKHDTTNKEADPGTEKETQVIEEEENNRYDCFEKLFSAVNMKQLSKQELINLMTDPKLAEHKNAVIHINNVAAQRLDTTWQFGEPTYIYQNGRNTLNPVFNSQKLCQHCNRKYTPNM